ncbi:MAG: hypothetical protein KF686_11690 [Ramlibacter sp.]|nr:hypothetical protein [Ramlibacter sp.]MBX3659808.1 hypothetical protein [Ramlibacter sp.]
MKKLLTPLLMAGLLAGAGLAQAQNTGASATNNMPAKAGEASTLTQGVPNAAKTVSAKSREEVKAEARAAVKSGTTSKGVAGTTDAKGMQVGLEPKPTDGKTRAELKAEREMQKAEKRADRNLAALSTAGMSTGVPAGNPSPLSGTGTPK